MLTKDHSNIIVDEKLNPKQIYLKNLFSKAPKMVVFKGGIIFIS
jgi:hypothetical protein